MTSSRHTGPRDEYKTYHMALVWAQATGTLRWHQRLYRFLRHKRVLTSLRITTTVDAESINDGSIENVKILIPAQDDISLGATPNEGKFLKICKYFREGIYCRPNVFVCEVPNANYHVGTGLACTKEFRAVSDSEMEYRLFACSSYRGFKPLRVRSLHGTYAVIYNVYGFQWWHWIVDCLPRIYSLLQAYPDQKITLLMPETLGETLRESLLCVLPANFEINYLPPNTWVSVERLILPSYVSTRSNGHIPSDYYRFIRERTFAHLSLPQHNILSERIYVSRANAKHRRVLNEEALIVLLNKYGFRTVLPETMTFGQQVELFHKAEAVVSMHGSSWGNIVFSGKIKILALYPDQPPNTHIFTLAKALGQEHFFVAGNEPSEHSDYCVDLVEVERVLRDEMMLGAF